MCQVADQELLQGVPWYLSVEGAIDSGVTAPLVRYQLCTASSSCGATYNFTVEYKSTCGAGESACCTPRDWVDSCGDGHAYAMQRVIRGSLGKGAT